MPRSRLSTALTDIVLGATPSFSAHRGIEAFTPERLTKTLRLGDARVVQAEVLEFGHGATDRCRLRLHWQSNTVRTTLPASVFVKSTPHSLPSRAMVATLRMAEVESRYYTELRHPTDKRSPRLFAARYRRGGRFLLVLEDLIAQGASVYSLADSCPIDHALSTIECLASLHADHWGSRQRPGWIRAENNRFGAPLLRTALRIVRRRAARLASRLNFPGDPIHFAEAVNYAQTRLERLTAGFATTICHGDPHLANTYALPGGGAGLLDWQNIHYSHGVRDVAYFVVTSLPVTVRRSHEEDLLRHYVACLAEHGAPRLPLSEAWKLYRYFAVGAWDTAAACASYGALQDARTGVEVLRRACVAVADLRLQQVLAEAVAGRLKPVQRMHRV